MSSPLKSFGDNSSSGADDIDKLTPSTSFDVDESFEARTNDVHVDQAIAGLKKCLQHYEEKVLQSEEQLKKFGFTVNDLPENLRVDLKETFKDDDGVFDFPLGSSEMVRISAEHVNNSLQEKYELGQMQALSSQLETLTEEFGRLHSGLQRKLCIEKEESEKIENKCFDKEAKLMIFNEKLEAALWELKNLKKLSQNNKKPMYSLEDLENLNQEVTKLNSNIAFTNTRLNRYCKLPLSEKDAQKHLDKMKEDLKNVDNEIRKKVCS